MRSSRINCSLATEFALVQENILLQNERITQLYVIQSEQNPFLWFGILFVDCGIYKGAVIRFSMYIDDTYPHCSCPKIVFDPCPYHPLVNPMTGELDTKNAFPHWDGNSRKLYELLLFVKRVIRHADEYITQIRDIMGESLSLQPLPPRQPLKGEFTVGSNSSSREEDASINGRQTMNSGSQDEQVIATTTATSHSDQEQQNLSSRDAIQGEVGIPPTTSNLDQDAFDQGTRDLFQWFHHTLDFIRVFENEPGEFERRVDEFKQKCCEQLFERPALCGNDINALVFTPWDMEVHEPMRSCVLAGRFTPTSMFATYHKDTDSVSFVPGHEPRRND